MVFRLKYLQAVFGVFFNSHRKISVRWVGMVVDLKQTAQNICSSDVLARSFLSLLRMWILSIWDIGKRLKTHVSRCLLFRHRKLSDYMSSNILCIEEL